ncbi:hypothetical protein [Winogradskyella pacifica]|uniref:hypothetical protein n=1 Tax=Winogradskyella pacifica TaxID=664642 RepID=UPI000E252927|nr:hypothetical protein [Winogradskyella pacifica]
MEVIIEFVFTAIFESLPKLIGTSLRWCYFLGTKSFGTVFSENWNKRIGFLAISVVLVILLSS